MPRPQNDSNKDDDRPPYDVLFVGFGPATLAIAVALAEQGFNPRQVRTPTFSSLGGLQEALCSVVAEEEEEVVEEQVKALRTSTPKPWKVCILEKHPSFKWHPGMLIQGSRMQISFLKDLATLRSPTSPFTFLSYLHSTSPSRLLSFISLGTLTPSRREYADYLSWAAERCCESVRESKGDVLFGETVVRIEALVPISGGDVELLRVTSRTNDGAEKHVIARNVVISTGGAPNIPRQLARLPSSRIIHSSTYLGQIDDLLSSTISPRTAHDTVKVVVIGGGQSSAEIFLSLHSKIESILERLPPTDSSKIRQVEIVLVTRKMALRPADDSPLSNEVFDPGMSQRVYGLGDGGGRERLLSESRNTNYSVVNPETLDAIYEKLYTQNVEDDIRGAVRASTSSTKTPVARPRLRIRPCSVLSTATSLPDTRVQLTFSNPMTSQEWSDDYDLVVCATGYNRQDPVQSILFPPTSKEEEVDGDCYCASVGSLFPPSSSSSSIEANTSSAFRLPSSSSSKSFSSNSRGSSPQSLSDDETQPSTAPSSSVCSLISKQSTPFSRASSSSSVPQWPPLSVRLGSVAENYQLTLPKEYERVSKEKVATKGKFLPTIWLQGSNEDTHGISDSLLSVLPIRATEVVNGLIEVGHF